MCSALDEFRRRVLEEVERLAHTLEADKLKLQFEGCPAGLPEDNTPLSLEDLSDAQGESAQNWRRAAGGTTPLVRQAPAACCPRLATQTSSPAEMAVSFKEQLADQHRGACSADDALHPGIQQGVANDCSFFSEGEQWTSVPSAQPRDNGEPSMEATGQLPEAPPPTPSFLNCDCSRQWCQPEGPGHREVTGRSCVEVAREPCEDTAFSSEKPPYDHVYTSEARAVLTDAATDSHTLAVSTQKGAEERVASGRFSGRLSRSMSVLDPRGHYLHQQRAKWSFDSRGLPQEFSLADNLRIEDAFWRGEERVRVRSGSHGEAPLEIWFRDMILFDPARKRKIDILRMPPAPVWLHLHRRVLRAANGSHQTFAQFEKLQKETISRLHMARQATGSLYYASGRCAFVARSVFMSYLFSFIVFLNAIWLGVEAEVNSQPIITQAHPAVLAVDCFFMLFFTAEIVVRFAAFKRKTLCFNSLAFLFDLLLVVANVCEVVVLPLVVLAFSISDESSKEFESLSMLRLIRLLRAARLGRVVQILRNVPEALVLLQGIRKSFRSLAVTLLLELLLVYSFGLVFRSYTAGSTEFAQVFFPDILCAMNTLIIRGLFLDGASMILLHDQITPEVGALFVVFVFLGCFLMLNVLVGTICEVITEVSKEQREEADVEFLVQFVLDLVECYADSNDNKLHRDDAELVLSNPEMRAAMSRFGVDIRGLSIAMKSHLAKDKSSDGCSVEEFLELILRCRRSNGASVADILQLQTFIESRLKLLPDSERGATEAESS